MKNLRFLILNTHYLEFLLWLYDQHPGLEKKSHEEQMQVRVGSLFGVADPAYQNWMVEEVAPVIFQIGRLAGSLGLLSR